MRFFAILTLLVAFGTYQINPDAPLLQSRSAILVDATTGDILFEKDADIPIPPASLTKLMTMHVVLEAIAEGRTSLDARVGLPRETWAINQPWGSSLMFLAPGQNVTLHEILLGLAVSSGNDAAVAAAIHTAGSLERFVVMMNDAARSFGTTVTHFIEPSGISEFNITTAREFAQICILYLKLHPEATRAYHSVAEFAYPAPHNLPEPYRSEAGTVIQRNRNILLDEIEGVDGLKTGFIIESGYNLALTAERAGTRFIAVLLGGPGPNSAIGGRVRANDGKSLIEWGFSHFQTVRPRIARLEPVRIWKSEGKWATAVPAVDLAFTLPIDRGERIDYRVERREGLTAPIPKGSELGRLVFFDATGPLKEVDLVAETDIPAGSFLRRTIDAITLFVLRLLGKIA